MNHDEFRISRPVHVKRQSGYDVDEIAESILSAMDDDGAALKGVEAFILYCEDVANGEAREASGTHPSVVIAAAEVLAAMGAAKIRAGGVSHPGCASRASFFSNNQADRLLRTCEIVDVHSLKRIRVKADKPLTQIDFRLPKIIFDSNFLLYLPKAKTSVTTSVCTSMDLTHQTLRGEGRLALQDYRLHQKLVDLHSCLAPDYSIFDAVTAGEGQGPMNPTPRQLGLLVCGANPANVDVAMSSLMGFKIHEVDHLRILADRGECASSAGTMDIRPAGSMERASAFRKAEWDIEGVCPWIGVTGGSEKYCPGGCVGFTRQVMDALGGAAALVGEPAHIVVGRPVSQPDTVVDSQRTLVVGDCASAMSGIGVFVPGCPPDIAALEYEMMKMLGTKGAGGARARLALKAGVPLAAVVESLRSGAASRGASGRISIAEIAARASRRILLGE